MRFSRFLPMAMTLCLICSSCTAIYGKHWPRAFFAEQLTAITLGEGKESVVEKLGGQYTPVASTVREGVQYEILEFAEKNRWIGRTNRAYWTLYWVYFVDNKCVKFERASQQMTIDRDNWHKEIRSIAMTMEAFKGTALMPYQVNQNVQHSGQVSQVHSGQVDTHITGSVDVY